MKERLQIISEEFGYLNEEKKKIESKSIKTQEDLDDLAAIEELYNHMREKLNNWASEKNEIDNKIKSEEIVEKSLKEQDEELSREIDNIMYQSKSMQPKFEGTDKNRKDQILESLGYVKTNTVDGREIRIHPSLVGKYYDLVKQRKEIRKELDKEYYQAREREKSSFNSKTNEVNEVENLIKEIMTSEESNVTEEQSQKNEPNEVENLIKEIMTSQENNVTEEQSQKNEPNEVANEIQSESLTREQELEQLKQRLEEEIDYILNKESGKKVFRKYKGEQFYIPERHKDHFLILLHRLEKTNKELNEIKNQHLNNENNMDDEILNIINQTLNLENGMQQEIDQPKNNLEEELISIDDVLNMNKENNDINTLSALSLEDKTEKNEILDDDEDLDLDGDFDYKSFLAQKSKAKNHEENPQYFESNFDDDFDNNFEIIPYNGEDIENYEEIFNEEEPRKQFLSDYLIDKAKNKYHKIKEEHQKAKEERINKDSKEEKPVFGFVKKIRKASKNIPKKVKIASAIIAASLLAMIAGGKLLNQKNNNNNIEYYEFGPKIESESTTPKDELETLIENNLNGGYELNYDGLNPYFLFQNLSQEDNSQEKEQEENVISEKEEAIEEKNDSKENLDENVDNEEEKIKIGKTIKLNEGSRIYRTGYDAYLDTNSYPAYFDHNDDRVILAVGITNENGMNFIYAGDENANQKIDALLNDGGEIVSILTSNKNRYLSNYDGSETLSNDEITAYAEGWYNINSVANENVKGKSM